LNPFWKNQGSKPKSKYPALAKEKEILMPSWTTLIDGIAGGALGGIGTVFALSRWLGSVWLEKQKAGYSKKLEEFKVTSSNLFSRGYLSSNARMYASGRYGNNDGLDIPSF
jgi:hypothetical protein